MSAALGAPAPSGSFWGAATAWLPTKRKCGEHHLRSVVKALTYRVAGSTLSAAIALAYTRKAGTALAVGGFDAIAKLVLFYAHERVWNRIDFGVVPAAEEPQP